MQIATLKGGLTMKSKIQVYTKTVLILSLLLGVLNSICFLFYFDKELGYFAPAFPVFLTKALTWISVLWCVSALFLFPKETIATQRNKKSPFFISVIAMGSSLLIAAGIGILVTNLASRNMLMLLCGLLILIGSAFFWTPLFSSQNTPAICGMILTLGYLFILITTHFDMFVAINSPIKTGLHLSVLVTVLFLLSEIRIFFGDEMPRAAFALKLLTILFCFPTAASHLVLYFGGKLSPLVARTLNPFFSLALLGVTIFAAAKLCTVKPVEKSPENNEEKEIEKI